MSARGEVEPACGDEIVHPGDLIVEGNTTLLIENCTFTVTGIVKVGDNATLIVRKAELNVSADTIAGIVILENDGTLILEEAGLNLNYDVKPSIHPYMRICDVDIGDKATLDVWKSRISSKLGRIRFRIGQHGRLILNSTSTSACENVIDANDDSEISIDESPIYSIELHGNASCAVKNTDIRYFSGSDQYIASFYNSTIGTIQFIFGSSSKAIIEGRFQGFHRYWNIYSNLTVEGIEWNMTLHDTTFTSFRLESIFDSTGMELKVLNQHLLSADIGRDSKLLMSNCTIKHLYCGRHNSVYSITSSQIGELNIGGNALVSISETEIDVLNVASDFKGALVFNNTSLNENLEIGDIPGPQFYMCGGLKFGVNFSISEGPTYEGPSYRANFTGSIQKFKIVRGYRVVARRDGKPLEKVQLKLYNEEDVMIWEGITDSDGEADFNITYCKNWILLPGYYYSNHTRTWSLEAIHGSTKYTTNGKLFSETPIIFNFPMPEPLWPLWQFWVVILVFIVITLFTTLYIQIRRKKSNNRGQTISILPHENLIFQAEKVR